MQKTACIWILKQAAIKYLMLFSVAFTGLNSAAQEQPLTDYPWGSLSPEPLYAYCWNLQVPGNETVDFSAYPYMHLWATIRHQTLHLRTPQQIAAHVQNMPEGHRVMFIFLIDRWMTDCTNTNYENPPHPSYHCPETPGFHDATLLIDSLGVCNYGTDSVWISALWRENGVAWMRDIMDDFFSQYKAAGGELDAIIMDTEKDINAGMAGANPNNACTRLFWETVANDPRFDAEGIMQELISRGWAPNTATLANTLFGARNSQAYLPESYYNNLIFNQLVKERTAAYYNQAFYDVARQYYPNVKLSNWDYYCHSRQYSVPHISGMHPHLLGNGVIVGNRQSQSLYSPEPPAVFPNARVYPDTLYTYHPGFYNGQTPFFGLLYDVNRMRAMYLSAPHLPIQPWIATKWWTCLTYNNDLHFEKIIHTGMTNADAWLYWFPDSPLSEQNHALFNLVTVEFNEMVGYAGRQPLTDSLLAWNAPAIATAVGIGGIRIWRFTPNPDSVFQMLSRGHIDNEPDVIMAVGSAIFSYSNATIHEYPNTAAPVGYWIVQDASPPSSVENNLSEKADILLFPNPSKHSVTLRNIPNGSTINITDITGKIIYSQKSAANQMDISTETLTAGIYIVLIEYNGRMMAKKLVVRE